MLEKIRDQTFKIIEEKYGLKVTQVVPFFHYIPSYFHLHIHFVHWKLLEEMGSGLG